VRVAAEEGVPVDYIKPRGGTVRQSQCMTRFAPGSEDEAAGITERANDGSKIESREHFIAEGASKE
jgi:hypothetical protein